MPAPTLVVCDSGNTTYAASTLVASQNDIFGSAGDIKGACGFSGGPDTLTFSSATLSWIPRVTSNTSSTATIWTAEPSTAGADTFFMNRTLADTTGVGATWYVFSGSGGGGATASNSNVGRPAASITTTTPHSVIVALDVDTNNGNTAATWLTNAGTFASYLDDTAGAMDVHNGYHIDVATIGTYTIGNSAPNSQIYDFVAFEVTSIPNTTPTAWIGV